MNQKVDWKEVVELYDRYKSGRKVAEDLNISWTQVYRILRKCGVETQNPFSKGTPNQESEADEELQQILTGELLGDGYLTIYNNCKNACFRHASKHREYSEYLLEKFKIYDPHILSRSVGKNKYFHLTTKSNTYLTKIYNQWYNLDGKKEKIIPEDIELTPLVIYHWWVGDGGFNNTKNGQSFANIHTEGFRKKYVDLLVEKLSEIGFESSLIREPRMKNKEFGYYIKINQNDLYKFITMMENNLKCFEYKFIIDFERYKNRSIYRHRFSDFNNGILKGNKKESHKFNHYISNKNRIINIDHIISSKTKFFSQKGLDQISKYYEEYKFQHN